MARSSFKGSIGGQTFAANTNGWMQRRKQRAGLLLTNGLLYVAFGGDNPDGLAGWLFVYDAGTLALKTVWSPTPNGRNGGIWMAGDAPAADAPATCICKPATAISRRDNLSFGDSLVKLAVSNRARSPSPAFSRRAIRCC